MKRKKGSIVFSGMVWSYAERFSAQMVSLVVSIILARLIAPEEYGVISLVTIFISIADVFATEGFGTALIQKKESDSLDFSTICWFSAFVSLIFLCLLWLISKPISFFFKCNELIWVMRIMSLKLPIVAFNSVQRAYVSKKLDFEKFFWATLVGTIISAVIGVFLAYNGFGVWALVAQYLLNSFIDTVMLFLIVKWRPNFEFSLVRLKPLVSYGWRILAVSLINSVYANIRSFVIGKKYSTEDLAYTNKGQQFPSLISSNINVSIKSVLFPALSNIQEDNTAVLDLSRKSIRVGTFLMAPLLLGLAAVANQVISLFLTDKWIQCVPYMQIMCLVYLLQPIQTASIQAMKALGKSRLYIRLEIVKKVLEIILLLIILVFSKSVLIIVWSALFAEIISTVMNLPVNKRIMNYRYRDQILDFGKPVFSGLVMWFGISVINGIIPISGNLVVLCLDIICGATIYFFMSFVLKDSGAEYLVLKLKAYKIKKKCNDNHD